MPALWIIDRDPSRRAALARLAGAREDALLAAPAQRQLEDPASARLILMGVAGDFELELEFAHRMAPVLRGAAWILLAEPPDLDEARRLFDTLAAEVLPFPPQALALRRRMEMALHRRRAEPLSERRVRDALAARFARWFADLELPELLRALDPKLASTPLLVRGEPGTGRSLLAQYVHAFGGTTGGAFVRVSCSGSTSAEAILASIGRAARTESARLALAVALEDVGQLAYDVQREVRAWIEGALPAAVPHAARPRWIATAADALWAGASELEPDLEDALAGVNLRIPPLRERRDAIPAQVAATAAAWLQERRAETRRFSEEAVAALREYPWPGNTRELEAVVARTLSECPLDPIPAAELRFHAAAAGAGSSTAWGALAAPAPSPARDRSAEEPIAEAVLESPGPAGEPAIPADAERGAPAAPAAEPEARMLGALHFALRTSLSDPEGRRLLTALAHEVRNPLVGISTLAQLLPSHFDDAEFRGRFTRGVAQDVGRIERVLEQLAEFAALEPASRAPVDVAQLLDDLLESHREEIAARRLLVLKELDRSQPFALADPAQLRFALEALLGRALELIPERGDLYLASKHHPSGLHGAASVRVLARFHSPQRVAPLPDRPGASLAENSVAFTLAQEILRAQGGELTLDATDADETLILLDLPAPA